jgi:hypothetical protein
VKKYEKISGIPFSVNVLSTTYTYVIDLVTAYGPTL